MRRMALFAAFMLVALATVPGRAEAQTQPVDVARTFYDAFVKADFATMERLYSPDVHWHDTIFDYKNREGTMGLWRFEIDPAKGGKVTYEIKSVDGDKVTVRWLDDYNFFGKRIHNDILSTLTVKDGKIVEHGETYSWDAWSRQALPSLGSFPQTAVGRVALMGLLRAGTYTLVAFQNFMRGFSMRAPRESKPEAEADKATPRSSGITTLLQREMGEGRGISER